MKTFAESIKEYGFLSQNMEEDFVEDVTYLPSYYVQGGEIIQDEDEDKRYLAILSIKAGKPLPNGIEVEDLNTLTIKNQSETHYLYFTNLEIPLLENKDYRLGTDYRILISNDTTFQNLDDVNNFPTSLLAIIEANRLLGKKIFSTNEECLAFFDRHYCVIMLGGKLSIMKKELQYGIISYSEHDFKVIHADKVIQTVNEVKKYNTITKKHEIESVIDEIKAAQFWIDSTKERYEGLIFDPNPNYYQSRQVYNSWKGFAVSPVSNGKANSYIEFIKEVICSNNMVHFDYLLDLMAQIIQYPHDKTGASIAIALRGIKGIGKSFFVEMFSKLFGSSFFPIKSIESITKRFNSVMQNKLLIFGDEALWKGDKEEVRKLKTLISAKDGEIEMKGKDSIYADNYCRFIFCTNDDWAAPTEKHERRYFVLDVSACRRNKKDYFMKISNDMNNGGYEDLLYILQNRNISERDFVSTLPITQRTIDSMIYGFESIDAFIYNSIKEQTLCRSCIETKTFYEEYKKYSQNKHVESPEILGKKLNEIFPKETKIKKQIRDGERIIRVYMFPSLDEQRKYFDDYIGFPIPWDEEDIFEVVEEEDGKKIIAELRKQQYDVF